MQNLGINAVEPTFNLMNTYRDNIKPFAGNSRLKSFLSGTFIFDKLKIQNHQEGYYLTLCDELRLNGVTIPKILVGGVRTLTFMEQVLLEKRADFFALSEPFIREPNLVEKIKLQKTNQVACVSCNMCFKHEGYHQTQCWRTNISSIIRHLLFSLRHSLNN